MNRTWAERCLTAACAAGLFLLCLPNFAIISGPLMLNDELGYLANAAALAGKDWRFIMENCGWYSYGWSLILVPLFRLFSSMPTILRCVNVINALAVVAVFFMQRSLLKRIFRLERPFLATVASAGACCYVGVLTQAELFWSETWLMFVYTLITLLVQRLAERPSGKRLAAFGASVYYLYVCHNRMLAVVIAAVLLVAALVARRSISLKGVLLFAASLAAAHIAFSFPKAYVVSANWGGVISGSNTLKGTLKLLSGRSQAASFKNLLLLIVTHAFSISLASYGLVPFALFMCAKRTAQLFRKGTKESNGPLLEMWMALSFLGLFAVTTLRWTAPDISYNGYKFIFFTRYFEPVCVLLIAYGFCALAQWASKRGAMRYSVLYTCLFAAAAVTAYMISAHVLNGAILNNDHFDKPDASGISFYLLRLGYRPEAVLVAGLCGAIGWNVLLLLFRGKDAAKMIAVAGFIAVNLKVLCVTCGDNRVSHLYCGQDLPLVDVVKSTDTHGLPIYVASENNDTCRFQCWLMDETLRRENGVHADQIPEERYYAIVSKAAFEELGYGEVNGEILGETQRHLFLYVDRQT